MIVVLVVASCALSAPQALASTSADTVSFTALAGPLTLNVGDAQVGRVQSDRSVSVRLPFTVTDARGSGAGWSVGASFFSTDSYARPAFAQVSSLNGDPGTPTVARLPTYLTAVTQQIVNAGPGEGGMGRFGGALDLTLKPDSEHNVVGELTLTLSSAP